MHLPTHALLTWIVAETGRLPDRRDRLLVLAAGVAPDLDALTVLGGHDCYFAWHRTLLHHGLAAAGFALVAFNPSFLATWTLSCAVLRSRPSVASVVEPARAPVLALGAAAGVVGWFLVLGAVVRRHRRRLSALRVWLLRGRGLALVIAGVAWLLRR